MKICVYAIAKNEAKFVERWMESMKEADEIYVLDTGSTDNTVELLKNCGAHVHIKKIDPWRFDVARNESLKLVPQDTDVCVCTDLDEVFDKGWRKHLEKAWKKDTTRVKYNYNWSLDENDNPLVNFYGEKIHTRNGYKWTHPVHEILSYEFEKENIVIIDKIILNHYPDNTKSRSNYLPLLELAVKESPEDDRNVHYLGREYMYYNKWNEAIDILIKHLNLKTATWKDERAASMRYIARCYRALKRYEEARMWLDKAMKETPHVREPYVERAMLEYDLENWKEIEKYGLKALEIIERQMYYINEPFSWDHTIYDLLSLSAYYQGYYQKALEYINLALKISPKHERLLNNKKLIENKIKELEKTE